jgi:WD40 repeat protein
MRRWVIVFGCWGLACGSGTAGQRSGSLVGAALAYHAAPAGAAALPTESRALVAPAGFRLERVLGRYDLYQEGLVAAAFLPEGRTLVSLGARGDLLIWDVVTRAPLRALPACAPAGAAAESLALSPDGALAAQGAADGSVCVRSLADGRIVRTWQAHDGAIPELAFTARGQLVTRGQRANEGLATVNKMAKIGDPEDREEGAAAGELRRWRVDTGARAGELAIGEGGAAAVAPDGGVVVAGSGRLRAWDEGGRARWDRACVGCRAVAFLPRAKQLVVVEARRVKLVSAADGAEVSELRTTGYLAPDAQWTDVLAVAPDGREAVTALAGSGLLVFWDLEGKREARRISENAFGVRAPSYAPDGSMLATVARDRLMLWDARRRAALPDLACNGAAVRSLALTSDGRLAVTGSDDGFSRIWDVAGGVEQSRWPASQVISTTFSQDGRRVLVADGHGQTKLSDATTGAPVWSIRARAPAAPARLSPDGSRIATLGVTDGLSVFEAATGKQLWSLPRRITGEKVVAFTADGRYVVSQDEKLRLGLWNAADGRFVRRLGDRPALPNLPNLGQVVTTADARRAVAAGGGLYVLDLGNGKVLRTLEKDWNGPLALTPDGAAVFTGETDRTVRLRRLDDGAELARIDLAPTRDRARSLAVSPDGARLFVGTERGVVLVYAMTARR